MNRTKNALIVAVGAMGTFLAVIFLWRYRLFLDAALILITLGFLLHFKKRRYIGVYLFGFLFGPLLEIAAIYFGAWQYTSPDFFGIPFWLPFVWGNAAITIASVYALFEKHD